MQIILVQGFYPLITRNFGEFFVIIFAYARECNRFSHLLVSEGFHPVSPVVV